MKKVPDVPSGHTRGREDQEKAQVLNIPSP
jgi:hypothetical protein